MCKRKLILFLSFLVIAVIPGCRQQLTPRQQLLLTQNTFIGAVNSLKILRDNDKINDDDIERIGRLIRQGEALLDKWTVAVLENKGVPDEIDSINIIIGRLLEYKQKGEENGQ